MPCLLQPRIAPPPGPSRRLRPGAAIAVLLGLGLAPADASAEGGSVPCDPLVATWIGGPSGELDAPRSWSTGLTPGPGTTVQFVNPAPVLASLTETDLSVRRVLVRGAKV